MPEAIFPMLVIKTIPFCYYYIIILFYIIVQLVQYFNSLRHNTGSNWNYSRMSGIILMSREKANYSHLVKTSTGSPINARTVFLLYGSCLQCKMRPDCVIESDYARFRSCKQENLDYRTFSILSCKVFLFVLI